MKNGFISISIVYSFVVIFLLVILSIVAVDINKLKLSNYVLDKAKQDVVEINEERNSANQYTLNQTFDYPYDVNEDYYKFTAIASGVFKLEAWGASGGAGAAGAPSGKGGYTMGYISLNVDDVLYIYVGSAGTTAGTSGTTLGGYNGGGSVIGYSTASYATGSGGGATDFRTVHGTWDNTTSLDSRILVAAGGGGGGGRYETSNYIGGAGGGTTGIAVVSSGTGGTQIAGGSTGGGKGYGGSAAIGRLGGGGGGYYGGGASSTTYYGGGGGSSYYGGVLAGSTLAGNVSIPAPGGGSETGHSGNGYARITVAILN